LEENGGRGNGAKEKIGYNVDENKRNYEEMGADESRPGP
jgi:hypothetical protein